MKQFSVIVPTKDRPESLLQCLAALFPTHQGFSESDYEVIITYDGNLPDALPSWVRLNKGPGRGPASNRNSGASVASGEWLLFVDDDCVPCPTLLKEYADAMIANPTIEVFEGRIIADLPKSSLADFSPINETGGLLWSCNFTIRTSLFKNLGGFNEAFISAAMEDVELRYRLNQKKIPVYFAAQALVVHPWRTRGGWASHLHHQSATFTYLKIHPEERKYINARYYFRLGIYGTLRDLIPGAVKFRGRGFSSALLEQASYFFMALRLGLRGIL